jgi:iron(III) transport system permease protein
MATTISVILIAVSMVFRPAAALRVAPQRLSRQHDQQADQDQLKGWRTRLPTFAVYAIGLLRCAAGDHLRHLLVPQNQRPGVPGASGFRATSASCSTSATWCAIRCPSRSRRCADRRHRHADRRACRAPHQTVNTSLLDGAFMIPYVMPGIVIGIAYIAAFNTGPLVLTGTAHDHHPVDLHPPPALFGAHHGLGAAADFAQHGRGGVSLGYSRSRLSCGSPCR